MKISQPVETDIAYKPAIENSELTSNNTGGLITFSGIPAKNRKVIMIAADNTIAQPAAVVPRIGFISD